MRALKRLSPPPWCLALASLLIVLPACEDDNDDDGTEADQFGVGAECSADSDCDEYEPEEDTGGYELTCLTQFTGGYCGLDDCLGNEDCPDGSACVAHDDGMNYCFRRCSDKGECNLNRDPDNESNCSSNIEFVEPTNGKACVPPSSG
jgi:hypothetical protein